MAFGHNAMSGDAVAGSTQASASAIVGDAYTKPNGKSLIMALKTDSPPYTTPKGKVIGANITPSIPAVLKRRRPQVYVYM